MRPKRLRASFLAGSGLGQRIILLPLDDGDLEPLGEFVRACHTLGTSGESLTHLERYLHEPSSFKGSDNTEETRRRIEEFLKQLSNVEDDLPLVMNGIELGWYKLGFLLNQVPALALIRATNAKSEAHGEDPIEGPLLALRATIEMLDIPQSIIEALNNLVERAQSGEDASDFYRGCQSIAQAIHSLLDVLVTQPKPSHS